MSSRAESDKQKQIQDKCQAILGNLLREEDNKYCVDCDAKGPRWASWNLGIFLCIRCAGIHRNLGVHISKVKSVNLDTWTPEQVACLQQMGNSQARAVYEANLPDSFRRPQIDPSLEAFIRAKYEQKKYIAKEWVPPPAPKPAFDIEEDKRKQKERKKSRTKTSNTVEIPVLPQHPAALPRPHSAVLQIQTSKLVQETPETTSQNQAPSTADLLNLDISSSQPSDDIFDAFLSAPQVPTAAVSSSVGSSADTESLSSSNNKTYDTTDLFTQMVSSNTVHNNKMTKESILSLYGTASSQSQPSQNIPSMYGLPGGMYIGQQNYSQMGMPRFSAVPSTALPNGISGVPHMAGVQQIQHQMANFQLQGQNWNIAGVNVAQVPSTGMIIGTEQPTGVLQWPSAAHGQTLSTNLWQ